MLALVIPAVASDSTWWEGAFFGAFIGIPGAIFFLVSLNELHHPPGLVLDARGFGMIRAHNVQNFQWKNVENFRIEMRKSIQRVVFDDVIKRRRTVIFRTTYGLPLKTLCSMMEAWRSAVLGIGRPEIT